jgi:hypothetical protein
VFVALLVVREVGKWNPVSGVRCLVYNCSPLPRVYTYGGLALKVADSQITAVYGYSSGPAPSSRLVTKPRSDRSNNKNLVMSPNLHRDLGIETVTDIIAKFAKSPEKRL